MLNNRETFTIDLRDLYGKKLDAAAAKSEKQTAKINKGLKSVSNTAKGTKKNVDDLSKSLSNVDRKAVKIKVDDREVTAATKKIKALENSSRRGSSAGGSGGFGGLGKSLLIGTAISLGSVALSAGISNAVAANAKYQKFEAVLSNTLGSRGVAKNAMEQISDFASKTPFQVDELTEGFVKLANQGFTPTLRQMTSMGDLAASTGKSYDQLVEAILDAQTGEFERLKEFGIRAQVQGDKVSFTFKGQTTVVDKSAEAMRNYVLSLGNAVGVSGSMAKISETTGGQLSNLSDNVDLLWKDLGERFNPEIKGSVGLLSNFVSTIRSWVAVPVEKKLNDEIIQIKALQAELNASNTSEERRRDILNELEQINPKILDGIDKQAVSYSKLAQNIDSVTGALRKKIFLDQYDKANAGTLTAFADANQKFDDRTGKIYSLIAQYAPDLAQRRDLSFGQMQQQLRKRLQATVAAGKDTKYYESIAGPGATVTVKRSREADALSELKANIFQANEAAAIVKGLSPKVSDINKSKDALTQQIDAALGNPLGEKKTPEIVDPNKPAKTLDTAGINSVNSGSSVKNITISINQLIGSYSINTTTLKEGISKAKDMVTEALLTAVNDANMAGGNQ